MANIAVTKAKITRIITVIKMIRKNDGDDAFSVRLYKPKINKHTSHTVAIVNEAHFFENT